MKVCDEKEQTSITHLFYIKTMMRTKGNLYIFSFLVLFSFLPYSMKAQPLQMDALVKIHPWAGKRVGYIGDSVTDPHNSASYNKYWTLLQHWLGITPYVYAISGREWNDVPHQALQLQKDHGDSIDAILIFMGTNDYNSSIPLGCWFVEKQVSVESAHGQPKAPVRVKQRTLSMDANTFRGRINLAMSLLKKIYPTKQIVLLTPLHRGYATFSDKNVQPDESHQNLCGEYIDAYVAVVKEAGNVWSVPIIDLNALCGLYPLEPAQQQYFNNPQTDQLHPNDAGHRRIAQTLFYQLLGLPCSF